MTLSADLSGKHALVTGASSGLGAHFAGVLARAGAAVTLAARRRDAIEANAAAIREEGGKAGAVVMDVTDTAAIEAGLAAATEAFGPVDVLVNNAGVAMTKRALETTDEDWDHVTGTNLDGVFFVARAVARRMVAAGRGGAIVNIASILGERVAAGVLPYAVAKAGVIQMTKGLALELARHGIRVTALAPGYVETDLNRDFFRTEAGEAIIRRIPQRRLGQMEDMDGPLLLLASDASRYMTGTVVFVDGGHLVSTL